MKLRYYLRGLGIGILVTAVILSVAAGNKQTMTDEEVMKRARELGMTESTLLSDQVSEEASTEKEVPESLPEEMYPQDERIQESQTVQEEKMTESLEEDQSEQDTGTEPLEEESNGTHTKEDALTLRIEISRGESSTTVSKSLRNAGLIEDAAEFDRYLCNNGYDKKIVTGTYEIPENSTFEEIALIITGRQ